MARWPSLHIISHSTVDFRAKCVKFTKARPRPSVTKISPRSLVLAIHDLWETTRAISVVTDLLVLFYKLLYDVLNIFVVMKN